MTNSYNDIRNAKDRAGIAKSLRALMRWWGWIEPLRLNRPEEQLLLASLLDSPEVSAFARVWAERVGRPIDWLVPVDAALVVAVLMASSVVTSRQMPKPPPTARNLERQPEIQEPAFPPLAPASRAAQD